jgi:hypothetical protein
MAFLTCPRIASVAIHGSNNGKQIANVLHARLPVDYTATDIANLSSVVATYVAAGYPGLCSDNLLLTDVTVTGLQNINDFQSTTSLGAVPGTVGPVPLPANNSLVVTFKSALTGRSARGRVYPFPTGSSNIAAAGADQYTTAYVGALEIFWQGLSVAINTTGWVHVILSKYTEKHIRPFGIGFVVTDVLCRNDTADSQRKRLPKGH